MDGQALRVACARYGIMENALVVLSHTDHNLVGAYVQDGCERILKLAASSHRSVELIQAEVDWMD